MKKLASLLLFVLFITSSVQAQNQYDCEIYGKITRKLESDQASFLIVDTPDFFNKEVYMGDIEKDGKFTVKFKKYFAGTVLLKFEQKQVEIFIQPGEKLAISFDPKDARIDKLEFIGNSPSVSFNRSMMAWEKQRISGNRYEQHMKDLNFAQIQDSVVKLKRQEMKLLQQFCLSNQCPTQFLQWARLDILYKEANYLMRYRWYNPLQNGKIPSKVIPKGYNYQFTRKFSLNQPLALGSINYRDYIHEHNIHWHYIAYAKKVLDPEAIDREKELTWILKNVEPGLARDLMLAENYGGVVRTGNKALIKKLTPKFLENMKYQPAKDYMKDLTQ